MAKWWTKPPIIVAALGVFAVIITALFSGTTITQQTFGPGSPAIGSAGRDVTITQQPMSQSPAEQNPATPSLPSSTSTSPPMSTPSGQPWWQQPPVIAAMIAALATLVAALIQRACATSPAKKLVRRKRPKS
jgi:hypothetical protein